MLKKLLITLALSLFTAFTFAAVEVNKAAQADLETIKGIGPAMSNRILDERKKATFKDWEDLIARVKGLGTGNAAKWSDAGLTVNGAGFSGAAAQPVKAAASKAAKK